jgi:branched-chain amino acid aminotransferase
MEGMKMLVNMDRDWIPAQAEHSLYIRPFMFSTDELIGVKPSDQYKFMIILSPTGPYYNTPMRIYVEEQFVRAAPGGVGYAKAAGNYGAAMHATAEAKRKGYDQVLWTDAHEHKYVQECGTMNVFFIIGNTAITPDLSSGTILAGVTRDSVLTVLQEIGLNVEERALSMDEVIEAHQLIVYNDEVNSFEYVILTLIEVCEHTPQQAEQCTLQIHFRGKCGVKTGGFDELVSMRNEICRRGISAEIEASA